MAIAADPDPFELFSQKTEAIVMFCLAAAAVATLGFMLPATLILWRFQLKSRLVWAIAGAAGGGVCALLVAGGLSLPYAMSGLAACVGAVHLLILRRILGVGRPNRRPKLR